MQERRERLAGRAPVQALERTVVEHAVDPPHLLVEAGVERTAPGQDLAHDAVNPTFHVRNESQRFARAFVRFLELSNKGLQIGRAHV